MSDSMLVRSLPIRDAATLEWGTCGDPEETGERETAKSTVVAAAAGNCDGTTRGVQPQQLPTLRRPPLHLTATSYRIGCRIYVCTGFAEPYSLRSCPPCCVRFTLYDKLQDAWGDVRTLGGIVRGSAGARRWWQKP